eukprot:COSAG02_NODE_406_length_22916_cov_35.137529_13_plen_91_part_00
MSAESVVAHAVDESASTEVRAYGTGDVHQSRDDQLQDLANNGLHRMLLDTGANRTIGEPSELNALLTGVVHSDIRVRGAFGSSAHHWRRW